MAHLPLRSLEMSATAGAAYDEWLAGLSGVSHTHSIDDIGPPEALGEPVRREHRE